MFFFHTILTYFFIAYSGWVDKKSGEKILDHEIKSRYESEILANTGVRIINPKTMFGYDPLNKQFLMQISLQNDMAPLEISEEEVGNIKQKHGKFLFFSVFITGKNFWRKFNLFQAMVLIFLKRMVFSLPVSKRELYSTFLKLPNLPDSSPDKFRPRGTLPFSEFPKISSNKLIELHCLP